MGPVPLTMGKTEKMLRYMKATFVKSSLDQIGLNFEPQGAEANTNSEQMNRICGYQKPTIKHNQRDKEMAYCII